VTEFTAGRVEMCEPYLTDLHVGVHKSETGLWNKYAVKNYDSDE
jgi:hypothetical protein